MSEAAATENYGQIPAHFHYRQAETPNVSCATCSFYAASFCHMFDTIVDPQWTCDAWEPATGSQEHIGKQEEAHATDGNYAAVAPSPEETEAWRAARTARSVTRRRKKQPTISETEANRLAHRAHEATPNYGSSDATNVGVAKEHTCGDGGCVHLSVVGVHKQGNGYIYRTSTRDGHYVGRTNVTMVRAVKGGVVCVRPNLFTKGEAGDFAWTNPNVMGRATGLAHSRRMLEGFAANHLTHLGKDGVPAPGDSGTGFSPSQQQTSEVPVGPANDSVHVKRPLKTISVFYGQAGKQRRRDMRVVKATTVGKGAQQKQIVYGVVLEPDTVDSQNDWVPADDVELAAHRYLAKSILGRTSVHRIQHGALGFSREKPKLVPVESFVAPVDFSYDGSEIVKKGSWVLGAHVMDKRLWSDIVNGKFTGWSVGGTGQRKSLSSPQIFKQVQGQGGSDPMHDDNFQERIITPEPVADPIWWKFGVDPDTFEVEFWGVDQEENPHHPPATRVTEYEGHIYKDGCIYMHTDRPTGLPESVRAAKMKSVLPIAEAWIRTFLHVEPHVDQSRPHDPMPPAEPEPKTQEPYRITKEEIEEAFRADERRTMRQLAKSVAELAQRPVAVPAITVEAPVIPAPNVTVENVVSAPEKPKQIRVVQNPDGSRSYLAE